MLNKRAFIKDVILLAFTAVGGPQAHIAMMIDLLVVRRQYLSEAELIELNALCQILPGPTSTQTITAIGYKFGGLKLALLTLGIWMFPALVLMTSLALLLSTFSSWINLDWFNYIHALAVSFIAVAAYKMARKTVASKLTMALFAGSFALCLAFPHPIVFPLILIAAGVIHSLLAVRQPAVKANYMKPNFMWLGLFALVLIGSQTALLYSEDKLLGLFSHFYGFGSMIFGGGQVLIPLLYEQIVQTQAWISSNDFFTGYSMVQAFPGPVFSFSAFVGALSMYDASIQEQLIGALVAAAGLFAPGTILIFFVYPAWEYLKRYAAIQRALGGINAAASAMVAAACIWMAQALELSLLNSTIISVAIFAMLQFKVAAPWLVIVGLVAGVITSFVA